MPRCRERWARHDLALWRRSTQVPPALDSRFVLDARRVDHHDLVNSTRSSLAFSSDLPPLRLRFWPSPQRQNGGSFSSLFPSQIRRKCQPSAPRQKAQKAELRIWSLCVHYSSYRGVGLLTPSVRLNTLPRVLRFLSTFSTTLRMASEFLLSITGTGESESDGGGRLLSCTRGVNVPTPPTSPHAGALDSACQLNSTFSPIHISTRQPDLLVSSLLSRGGVAACQHLHTNMQSLFALNPK